MNLIEIRSDTGDVERRELSKSQPVSIGKHRSSDIRITERGVAAMHCRISWNKTAYEVTAATPDGVDVNGTLVRHWLLSTGDVIRIGTYEICLLEPKQSMSSSRKEQPAPPNSDVALKPISEDELPLYARIPEKPPEQFRPDDSEPRSTSTSKSTPPVPAEPDEIPARPATLFEIEILEDEFDYEDHHEEPQSEAANGETKIAASGFAKLKARFTAPPSRPGEQDALRSPLVLILSGTAVVLLLMAATFWFIIGRETVQRQFETAERHKRQGDYSRAIQLFEEFLENYPNHKYTEPARFQLALTRIEKEINGSTPNWTGGFEALLSFIDKHRDSDSFHESHSGICQDARQIALGAAKSAQVSKRKELLTVSENARTMLERFSPPEEPPSEDLRLIATALRSAAAAILKQDTLDAAVTEIEQAISQKLPMQALLARQNLLARYAELSSNSQVEELLQKTLDTQRDLVEFQDLDRKAANEDPDRRSQPAVSLALHTRSRSDEESQNRTVFAYAQGCCYGIDTVTGNVLWRRVIGLDAAFFPKRVETSVPAVLLFNTISQQLLLLNRHSGNLVWSQSIEDQSAGPPLVTAGQIFLPTTGGQLFAIDLETGRITTVLKFSQKLCAPPALMSDRQHFAIAGDRELLYTVSMRPLRCVAVSYLGHKAGSIEAPIIPMGNLLLLAENELDHCKLHLLDTRPDPKQLRRTTTTRLDGLVREPPVLRGNQLFVPSSLERITAFIVSDEPGQTALSRVAQFRSPTSRKVPIHLAAGADGQLWMAGSTLNKLRLTADSLQLDPNQVPIGLSSQPLQSIGEDLFVARRLTASGAVVFVPANRIDLSSRWKTILGSSILSVLPGSADALLCLTSNGDLFRITETDLMVGGGFKYRPILQLQVSESLESPLTAARLANGSLAVHSGNPDPKLWIVNPQAQITRRLNLRQPLVSHPVILGDRLVLPYPNVIHVVAADGADVEVLPADVERDERRTWRAIKSLDPLHLITTDSQGKLSRLQLRNDPAPAHLAEVVRVDLEDPVDVELLIDGDRVVLADAGKRLQVLDSSNLAPVASTTLQKTASNGPWLQNGHLLIETGRDHLSCFNVSRELKLLWSIPLNEPLADAPITVGQRLLFAATDGQIVAVNLQSGEVVGRMTLRQQIGGGPWKTGNAILVGSIDGSLYRIESILEEAP